MAFMIWGISMVVTVNLKVAYATHEAPFSPRGRRDGGRGGIQGACFLYATNDSGVHAGMRTASRGERS